MHIHRQTYWKLRLILSHTCGFMIPGPFHCLAVQSLHWSRWLKRHAGTPNPPCLLCNTHKGLQVPAKDLWSTCGSVLIAAQPATQWLNINSFIHVILSMPLMDVDTSRIQSQVSFSVLLHITLSSTNMRHLLNRTALTEINNLLQYQRHKMQLFYN